MGQSLAKHVQQEVTHLIATGVSQLEAAERTGISGKSAWRIAKKNKKQIEQLALELINESVPLIKLNHINTLKAANHVLSATLTDDNGTESPDLETIRNNKDIIALADKKELRALQVMGIAPSHAPSVIINQLFNQDNRTQLSPAMQDLFHAQADSQEAEEAEYEVID